MKVLVVSIVIDPTNQPVRGEGKTVEVEVEIEVEVVVGSVTGTLICVDGGALVGRETVIETETDIGIEAGIEGLQRKGVEVVADIAVRVGIDEKTIHTCHVYICDVFLPHLRFVLLFNIPFIHVSPFPLTQLEIRFTIPKMRSIEAIINSPV